MSLLNLSSGSNDGAIKPTPCLKSLLKLGLASLGIERDFKDYALLVIGIDTVCIKFPDPVPAKSGHAIGLTSENGFHKVYRLESEPVMSLTKGAVLLIMNENLLQVSRRVDHVGDGTGLGVCFNRLNHFKWSQRVEPPWS